jgi:hypothetical protein
LALTIELKLEKTFAEAVRRAQRDHQACTSHEAMARGPLKSWKPLYDEWAKVPDALAKMKDGIRANGVPLLKADMPHQRGAAE